MLVIAVRLLTPGFAENHRPYALANVRRLVPEKGYVLSDLKAEVMLPERPWPGRDRYGRSPGRGFIEQNPMVE